MYYRLVMGLKLDKDSGEEDKRGSYIMLALSQTQYSGLLKY